MMSTQQYAEIGQEKQVTLVQGFIWGGGAGYGSPPKQKGSTPKIKLCRLNFCEGILGYAQLQQTDL